MIESISTFIIKKGLDIINDPALNSDPVELVSVLISFWTKMDNLVIKSFLDARNFRDRALNSSFRNFMVQSKSIPINLAVYCDFILRSTSQSNE